jgi:hypothetical protein
MSPRSVRIDSARLLGAAGLLVWTVAGCGGGGAIPRKPRNTSAGFPVPPAGGGAGGSGNPGFDAGDEEIPDAEPESGFDVPPRSDGHRGFGGAKGSPDASDDLAAAGGTSGTGGAPLDAAVIVPDAFVPPDVARDTALPHDTTSTLPDLAIDHPVVHPDAPVATVDAAVDQRPVARDVAPDLARDLRPDLAPDTGGGGGTGCETPGLVWKTASKTYFTSYPAPGSEECIVYSGCMYEGQFSACSDTKTKAWVMSHNIVSFFPNFNAFKLHDLCLKSGTKTIVVTVYDTCADTDCGGCCSQNKGNADALIDIESYTNDRWGVGDGRIQWADLGPTKGAGCK